MQKRWTAGELRPVDAFTGVCPDSPPLPSSSRECDAVYGAASVRSREECDGSSALLSSSSLFPQWPLTEALQYLCEHWALQYEHVKKLLSVAPRSHCPRVQRVLACAERLYHSATLCSSDRYTARHSLPTVTTDMALVEDDDVKCNVELLQSALVSLADCAAARRDKTLRTVMGLLFNAGEHLMGLLHQQHRPTDAVTTDINDTASMAMLLALLKQTPERIGADTSASSSTIMTTMNAVPPTRTSFAANRCGLRDQCRWFLAQLLRAATLETFGSCFVWIVWNHRANNVEVLETRDATCPLLLEGGIPRLHPERRVTILFGCDMFEHQYICPESREREYEADLSDEFSMYVQHVCETLPVELIASRVRLATRGVALSHL